MDDESKEPTDIEIALKSCSIMQKNASINNIYCGKDAGEQKLSKVISKREKALKKNGYI